MGVRICPLGINDAINYVTCQEEACSYFVLLNSQIYLADKMGKNASTYIKRETKAISTQLKNTLGDGNI